MEELQIKVFKDDVLTRIEKHKARFVKSYEALLKAYEKKAMKYQKDYAKFLEKVKEISKVKEPIPPNKPIDRREKYDLYIEMLQEHKGKFIKLSESLYRHLWKDKWDWISSHIYALQAYANDADVSAALNMYEA